MYTETHEDEEREGVSKQEFEEASNPHENTAVEDDLRTVAS